MEDCTIEDLLCSREDIIMENERLREEIRELRELNNANYAELKGLRAIVLMPNTEVIN